MLWQNQKDNKKKFYLLQEQRNLKNSRKKKPSKNLKLRRWNKNSWLPKLFKRPKQPLPRKLQLKLTLLDLRESTNSPEERLRHNCKCLKLNNKWKLSQQWKWKKTDWLKMLKNQELTLTKKPVKQHWCKRKVKKKLKLKLKRPQLKLKLLQKRKPLKKSNKLQKLRQLQKKLKPQDRRLNKKEKKPKSRNRSKNRKEPLRRRKLLNKQPNKKSIAKNT